MLQICYSSRTVRPLGRRAYADLADAAQVLNGRDEITGLLLYDGVRFAQALEGPEAPVKACMARIARDARHRDVSILAQAPVPRREFGSFAMVALMPEEDGPFRFVDRVKALVDDVASPRLKAAFIGFALLSRARASA